MLANHTKTTSNIKKQTPQQSVIPMLNKDSKHVNSSSSKHATSKEKNQYFTPQPLAEYCLNLLEQTLQQHDPTLQLNILNSHHEGDLVQNADLNFNADLNSNYSRLKTNIKQTERRTPKQRERQRVQLDSPQIIFTEPAAGDGIFYDRLPPSRRLGYEIDALVGGTRPYRVIASDGGFLDLTRTQYQHDVNNLNVVSPLTPNNNNNNNNTTSVQPKIHVAIGNPPYAPDACPNVVAKGRRTNLALQFIKHCDYLNMHYCGFVLGTNFLRPNMHTQLPKHSRVLLCHDLGKHNFGVGGYQHLVGCCFLVVAFHQAPLMPTPETTDITSKGTLANHFRQLTISKNKSLHTTTNSTTPSNVCVNYKEGCFHGPFTIIMPTDTSANLAITRWGCVGTVFDKIDVVQGKVNDEINKEWKREQDTTKTQYKTGRTYATNYFLHVPPKHLALVTRIFHAAKPLYKSTTASYTSGNNPSISIPIFLSIFIQSTKDLLENDYIHNGNSLTNQNEMKITGNVSK